MSDNEAKASPEPMEMKAAGSVHPSGKQSLNMVEKFGQEIFRLEQTPNSCLGERFTIQFYDACIKFSRTYPKRMPLPYCVVLAAIVMTAITYIAENETVGVVLGLLAFVFFYFCPIGNVNDTDCIARHKIIGVEYGGRTACCFRKEWVSFQLSDKIKYKFYERYKTVSIMLERGNVDMDKVLGYTYGALHMASNQAHMLSHLIEGNLATPCEPARIMNDEEAPLVGRDNAVGIGEQFGSPLFTVKSNKEATHQFTLTFYSTVVTARTDTSRCCGCSKTFSLKCIPKYKIVGAKISGINICGISCCAVQHLTFTLSEKQKRNQTLGIVVQGKVDMDQILAYTYGPLAADPKLTESNHLLAHMINDRLADKAKTKMAIPGYSS